MCREDARVVNICVMSVEGCICIWWVSIGVSM